MMYCEYKIFQAVVKTLTKVEELAAYKMYMEEWSSLLLHKKIIKNLNFPVEVF